MSCKKSPCTFCLLLLLQTITNQYRIWHNLTFVTVLYSEGSLGWFVVSHVAQSFTFPCGLIFDDHAILNITIFLKETQTDGGKSKEWKDSHIELGRDSSYCKYFILYVLHCIAYLKGLIKPKWEMAVVTLKVSLRSSSEKVLGIMTKILVSSSSSTSLCLVEDRDWAINT